MQWLRWTKRRRACLAAQLISAISMGRVGRLRLRDRHRAVRRWWCRADGLHIRFARDCLARVRCSAHVQFRQPRTRPRGKADKPTSTKITTLAPAPLESAEIQLLHGEA